VIEPRMNAMNIQALEEFLTALNLPRHERTHRTQKKDGLSVGGEFRQNHC